MATPIEEQIHRHAQALADEKAKAANRKLRPIPKPWTRLHPQGLCQDVEFLEMVREFDYHLEDERFQAYCRARGVIHVAGAKGSRLWQYMLEHWRTREEYSRELQCGPEDLEDGKRRQFTKVDLESYWAVLQLGRAKLQDCWELYRSLDREGGVERLLDQCAVRPPDS